MAAAHGVIAIVDDDAMVRRSLSRLVHSMSFQVTDFDSGKALLESLSQGDPACILLDLHMPDLTGLDVLKSLQSRQPPIPTIIITGHVSSDMREQCMKAGAFTYLQKPLDRDVVLQTIQAATVNPNEEIPYSGYDDTNPVPIDK